MKLIIDIPEWKYKSICEGVEASKRCGVVGIDPGIHEAIYNGTTLASVKAEIEKQIERDFAFAETETLKVPCHYGIANGLQNAIRFLNNIGKAESEDKE